MSKLWKKTGTITNNSDLVEVDPATLSVDRPTVVYFPGGLTTDNKPDFISIDLRDINNLFQGQPNPPQVYLASHPETEVEVETKKKKRVLSSIFRSAVYTLSLHRMPKPTPTEAAFLSRTLTYHVSLNRSSSPVARELAKQLVKPLVSSADGQRLPYEEAQKNLRNLTFMGYCIGGLVAQEIYNTSRKMMQEIGYNKKETHQLLQEIVLVTIASYAEPRKEENRYTTVSLIGQDDRFIRGRETVLHPWRKVFFRLGRRLQIKQTSDTSIFVSAASRGKWRDRNEETVINNIHLPAWEGPASNHLFRDYVNTNDEGSQFSRIVQHALINAANRNDKVKPLDLLIPPATLEAETKIKYQLKIQQALCR